MLIMYIQTAGAKGRDQSFRPKGKNTAASTDNQMCGTMRMCGQVRIAPTMKLCTNTRGQSQCDNTHRHREDLRNTNLHGRVGSSAKGHRP